MVKFYIVTVELLAYSKGAYEFEKKMFARAPVVYERRLIKGADENLRSLMLMLLNSIVEDSLTINDPLETVSSIIITFRVA